MSRAFEDLEAGDAVAFVSTYEAIWAHVGTIVTFHISYYYAICINWVNKLYSITHHIFWCFV